MQMLDLFFENVFYLFQIDVTLATLDDGNHVKCSRNVTIVPDAKLNDVSSDAFDCLILPGGMNAAKTFANVKHIMF